MDLPLEPPVAPMLARLARELPLGAEWLYEPKWDGFRCLAFAAEAGVELRSRNDRPLGRYFPELVEALAALPERAVLDGEILASPPEGSDFSALMSRLHPAASRVARLREEVPAELIAFDLLAVGGEDLRELAFAERRRRLLELVAPGRGRVATTPITGRPQLAEQWLERAGSGGIDGVVAKRRDLRYEAGARAMVKVKRERTLECVVAGYRPFVERPLPAALLLGLWDGDELRHIGVASQFTEARRHELQDELEGLATPLRGHPWEHGYLVGGGHTGRLPGAAGAWRPGEMELDWIALDPSLVCEVAYDHLDHGRLRHPARFRRWRPDRDARSCTFEQIDQPGDVTARGAA